MTRAAIWYEADARTPVLDADAFALDFSLDEEEDDRVSLRAAYRVPGKFVPLYGGRVTAALLIVAVDVRSGRVFARPAEPGHVVPLAPGRMRGKVPLALSGTFGVDLARHLELPDAARTYAVFLWLDELTSPVRLVDVVPAWPPSGEKLLKVREAPPVSPPQPGDVALENGPAGARPRGRLGSVAGSAYLPGRTDGEPLVAVGLAVCDRTHRLGWRATALPPGVAREWTFELALDPLVAAGARPERLFVVACVAGLRSDVVTVPVERGAS